MAMIDYGVAIATCSNQFIPECSVRNLFTLFLLVTALGLTTSAQAQSCSLARTGTLDFGRQTIKLPRDSSSGTEIARRTISYRMSCAGLPRGYRIAVKFRPNVANCVVNGNPNFLSTNTIPSIGISFAATPVPPGGTGSSAICTTSSTSVNGRFFDLLLKPITRASETFDFSITAALVKTSGPLRTGSTSFSGDIGTLDWVILGRGGNLQFANNHTVSASATAVVSALTCAISNITVPMGSVAASTLAGRGEKTAPWKSFSIVANNCPAMMSRIRFSLLNTNPMLDAAAKVMAVTAGSDSARGIGIQIAHDDIDQTILAFSQRYDARGYASIQGAGGSLSIPLKARYYKPGAVAAVTPGKANGLASVVMSYE